MSGKRKELLVSVGHLENCSQVGIDEESPRIVDLAAFGALVRILAEYLEEEAQCVARIVRSKVLNLTFQKDSESVNYALEGCEVELVEDAKVLDGVPLHSPLFIARVYCHFDGLWNESILKI